MKEETEETDDGVKGEAAERKLQPTEDSPWFTNDPLATINLGPAYVTSMPIADPNSADLLAFPYACCSHRDVEEIQRPYELELLPFAQAFSKSQA